MASTVKRNIDKKSSPNKSARSSAGKTVHRTNVQSIKNRSRKQAKKIVKALDEVEKIRSGKIKPIDFESHFGDL